MFTNLIHPTLTENPFVEAARLWLRQNWAKELARGEDWASLTKYVIFAYDLSDEQADEVIAEIQKEAK